MSVIENIDMLKVDELNLMLDSVKQTVNNTNKEYGKILNYINDKIKSDLDDVNKIMKDKIKEIFKEIDKYIKQDNKIDDEQYKCFSFVDICCSMKYLSYLGDGCNYHYYLKYDNLIDRIKKEGLGLISFQYCDRDNINYSPLCIDLNYLLNKNKLFTVEIFKDKGYEVKKYKEQNFITGPYIFNRFFKDFCKDKLTEEQLNDYLLSFIDLSYCLLNDNERQKNKNKLFEEILLYV